MTLNPGMMSSDKDDWCTPKNLLAVIRQYRPIALDPCSNAQSIVGAAKAYTKEQDGLSLSWDIEGLVYVNPPYGAQLIDWVSRADIDCRIGRADIIMLVPARTDPKWFQLAMFRATEVCFWNGRLTFLGAPSSAPFPSALIHWSPTRELSGRFIDVFTEHGTVVTVNR